MSNCRHLLSALILSFAAACGSSEKASDTMPASEAAAPSEAVTEPAAMPAAEGGSEPIVITNIEVVEMKNTSSGPTTETLSLDASITGGGYANIAFKNLVHYCEPAPSFSALAQGTTLTLSLDPPGSTLSKCFGPFDGSVTMPLPEGAELTEVVILAADGKELGRSSLGYSE